MLIFNDEPITLQQVAPELFDKKSGKLKATEKKKYVRFLLHASQKVWDADLKRFNIPAGKYLDPLLNYTLPETSAKGVLRYCDSYNPRPDGKGGTIKNYVPDHLVIDDRCEVTVETANVELLWFWRQLPQNEVNAVKRNETPWFYEEDLIAKAEKDMDGIRATRLALNMIDGEEEEGGLGHEELRMLAKVLYMTTADEADIIEVRSYLANIAKTRPQDIVNKQKDPSTQLKAMVRDAEKLGIIRYKPDTFNWAILENGVREVSVICKSAPGREPVEYLVDYLTNYDEQRTLDYIRSAVADMKEIALAGK